MTIRELIEALKAIEEGKPFSVPFQLQWSAKGELTLQELTERIHPKRLRVFLGKVENAEPPEYTNSRTKGGHDELPG